MAANRNAGIGREQSRSCRPMAVVRSASWNREPTVCTSGFVDDVMLAHNGAAWATQGEVTSHSLWSTIRSPFCGYVSCMVSTASH